MDQAPRVLGVNHGTVIELRFQAAQTAYKTHFFGRDGYRAELMMSLEAHCSLHAQSMRVLGLRHPMTLKIDASLLKCFDEQLDWSLDDIPSKILEYHALLLEAARRRGVR